MYSSICPYPETSVHVDPMCAPIRPAVTSASTAEMSMPDRDTLFLQFSPLVRRLVRQYGRTPEMREDLFGELYCLFRGFLDRYDPTRGIPLNAYLVRHLTTSAYTYARKQWNRARRETPLVEDIDAHLPTSCPTAEWDRALDMDRLAAALPTMISGLPLRQRQVVIWRYYEERSFEEIAQIMQIEPSSVRSLLRCGLNKIRLQTAEWK